MAKDSRTHDPDQEIRAENTKLYPNGTKYKIQALPSRLYLPMTLNKIPDLSECLFSHLSNAKCKGLFSTQWLENLWIASDKISMLSAHGADVIFRTTCLGDISRTIYLCVSDTRSLGSEQRQSRSTGHRLGVSA